MGYVYTKKEENKERDAKTINAEEYVNRMFNQQVKQDQEAEEPRIESTK